MAQIYHPHLRFRLPQCQTIRNYRYPLHVTVFFSSFIFDQIKLLRINVAISFCIFPRFILSSIKMIFHSSIAEGIVYVSSDIIQ